jgi:hypothetical protein
LRGPSPGTAAISNLLVYRQLCYMGTTKEEPYVTVSGARAMTSGAF